jgi:hypothetical protein
MVSSRYLEVRVTREVPKYLADFIKLRGGENRYGEPRYRVVWGPDRWEQAGGEWLEWDESLGVNDRNYVNRKGEALNKPLRIVEDLRWIRKYPVENKWVLEKWLPAESFGDPDTWYRAVSPSGKYPSLGKYPTFGDYESTGYEFPNEALTEGILGNAIGRIEHYVDALPSTSEGRVKRAKYLAQHRDDEKESRLEKKHLEIVQDSGFAFSGKPFMSFAGDKRKSDRDATAERIGVNPINL